MKIACALFKYFPFGGLQNDFMRIALELVKLGHEIVCFCGEWNDAPPEEFHVELVKLTKRTNHGRAKEFEKQFRKFITQNRFDVTIAFNRLGPTDYYFAADDCLARSMREKHSRLALTLLPRYRTLLAMEKAIFSPAAKTKIMYISERQKKDFQAFYHTPSERFRYLPPGINPSCIRPPGAETIREAVRAELGVADNEFMLLTVASNLEVKGGDRAIEALAALPDEIRLKCRLFLVGDGKYAKYESLAKKLGVDGRTNFFGGRRDVNRFMLAADLMVHPARKEAAGSVITESLAAGTPVICTSVCGFAEFAEKAGGVVLDEPFRPDELTRAIEKLLASNGAELEEAKKKTLAFGAKTDFCERTSKTCTIVLNLPEKREKDNEGDDAND